MERKLFEPISINQVTLKNRIAMSPMCMYACEQEDGKVTPFHITHYESRAVGQTGLVMLEATSIQPEGRISPQDLGIWEDSQIKDLKHLTSRIHAHGAKSGIQLAHAGRKARNSGPILAPSPIAFNENLESPNEMTTGDIDETIKAFKNAARRAKEANFDIIEIHAAHGYLINQFLSPLTNHRNDEYGGTKENRYTFLQKAIEAVQSENDSPIFVRISASEYHKDGNSYEDFVYFSNQMKNQGVALVDCSSGGVVPAQITPYPGYQVPFAEKLKHDVGIKTGAVGLITNGAQAEEILRNNRADLVFIGRPMLLNPYWTKQVSDELDVKIEAPSSYQKIW
ncbi:NADPH dehydrogenase NamA [Halalkalibacillus halophilus]|uniref:NADPH dehydrogenase NamA n=1 Tax=Halalkalibacillus halophilus TaxID=392827 RepID=UPI00042078CC|nr:NADPH dehydrogenase NamA [Halalkalibacillus halophilus]